MENKSAILRNFRIMGAILAFIGAACAFNYGMSIKSWLPLRTLLALGMVCACIGSAYVWIFFLDAVRARDKWMIVGLLLLGLMCTGTEILTGFGTVSTHKATDVNAANLQTTKAKLAVVQMTDDERTVAEQRAELEKIMAANEWATTVNAIALRKELPALKLAVDQEAANGGCKGRCLIKTQALNAKEQQIEIAERADFLKKSIASANLKVASQRKVVETTEQGESGVANQNLELASFFTQSLEPSQEVQHWAHRYTTLWFVCFMAFGAIGFNILGHGGGHGGAARGGNGGGHSYHHDPMQGMTGAPLGSASVMPFQQQVTGSRHDVALHVVAPQGAPPVDPYASYPNSGNRIVGVKSGSSFASRLHAIGQRFQATPSHG